MDDMQHCAVPLPVWVGVVGTDNKNHAYFLRTVRVLHFALAGAHNDVRLGNFIRSRLAFVVALNDWQVLHIYAYGARIARRAGEYLPGKQLFQVGRKGVLQKF